MSISDINIPFGITQNASEHGGLVDHMLGFVHWVMLFLFIGWSTYLIYVFWKYCASNTPKADYHGVRGHATTEISLFAPCASLRRSFGKSSIRAAAKRS